MNRQAVLLVAVVGAFSAQGSAVAAGAPSASWLQQVQGDIAEEEYEVTAQPGAVWQAPNRAQGFRAFWTAEGIRVVPREGSAWEWSLLLREVGRLGSLNPVERAAPRADGHRVEYVRGVIREEYLNDPRGIEQVFTLATAPSREREKASPVVLELSLGGTLSAFPTADGQAIDFKSPSGARVLHYGELHVTDATGRELPARMAASVRDVRLEFDDEDAVYPVTVDPLATSPAWVVESNQGDAFLGVSVSTAGDVNGDGFSDVIAGASVYDNGQVNEGRVFVYLGSASALSTTWAWSAEGNQASSRFGFASGTAGDVNGDGYDDVVVGAYRYDEVMTDEGKAFVYLGSASGLAAGPAWQVRGGQASGFFGFSVGTAGDVNGDGYADLAVGAVDYDLGQTDEGCVFVYLGSSSGLNTGTNYIAQANQAGAQLGYALGTAGDVNGDGYDDVVMGENLWGATDTGAAIVFYGSASGLTGSGHAINGTEAGALFGDSVGTAGDVNGDGYADVVIGAYQHSNGQTNEGLASVYYGSATGVTSTAAWTVESDQAGALFGTAVATAGDVNGDGYADVLVSAASFDNGQTDEGRVFLYLGSASGLATTAAWTAESDAADGSFGSAVGTAGDVNGDGYSDVIVGASGWDNGTTEINEGRAYVYLGSAAGLSTAEGWSVTAALAGASAGDINADGYSDVIVGESSYNGGQGRSLLFLGSARGLASSPAWTMEGPTTPTSFGSSVASAGDVNGDGYADVLVGARGMNFEGSVFLYLGSASGLDTIPTRTFNGPQNDHLGYAMSTVGDFNGDGFADVVLGASGAGSSDEGATYLYLGSASGLTGPPVLVLQGDSVFQGAFGFSVAGAGDVDGDGYDDVLVGSSPLSPVKSVYLYRGAPQNPSSLYAWKSSGADSDYGHAVSTAGDVNGDGYADVLVGARLYDTAISNVGRAYLYLGSASGLGPTAAWITEGTAADDRLGSSVSTAGDVNGDGYADVVVGGGDPGATSPGSARVFLGSPSGLAATASWMIEGQAEGAGETAVGRSVATAGDVNGDGYADVLLASNARHRAYYGGGGNGLGPGPRQATGGGAPLGLHGKSDSETGFRVRATGRTPAGRTRIRLQWEVAALGASFDGNPDGVSALLDTGAPGPAGGGVELDQPVTSLDEGTFYHWRMKIVSRNPFFPRSPWLTMAGNSGTETKLRTFGCIDGDGDGYGAIDGDPSCASPVRDCNDLDTTSWGIPGETTNLRFLSKTVLAWDAPASPGGSPIVYDTMRSQVATTFLSGTVCLESNDGSDTAATDLVNPAPGSAFFYVSRGESGCTSGAGSSGTTSSGLSRPARNCP